MYPRFFLNQWIPAGHRRLAALLLWLLALAVSSIPQAGYAQTSPAIAGTRPMPKFRAISTYTYKIRPLSDGSFGYDLFSDGKVVVRQTSKPALPGTRGFETKEQATRAAELVLLKIKQGQMPPTLSAGEVKAIITN